MSFNAKLEGVDTLKQALVKGLEIGYVTEAVATKVGTQLFNEMGTQTPWKSGELTRSRAVTPIEGGVEFGYVKEYAPHVEYGHRAGRTGYVNGQKFLQAVVSKYESVFASDIEKEVKKLL